MNVEIKVMSNEYYSYSIPSPRIKDSQGSVVALDQLEGLGGQGGHPTAWFRAGRANKLHGGGLGHVPALCFEDRGHPAFYFLSYIL